MKPINFNLLFGLFFGILAVGCSDKNEIPVDADDNFITSVVLSVNDKTYDVVIENNSMRVATGVLNEIVTEAVAMQQPPTDKGKRLKIYYVTQVAVKPPTFVVFVNDKNLMHFSYTRYLENRIRETFGFRGTALKFITRERKED